MRSNSIPRAGRTACAVLAATLPAIALPAAADAQTAPAPAAAPAERGATATVTPRIGVAVRRLQVRRGGRAVVAGRVRPSRAGLRVHLQVRRGSRWATIDRARTTANGRYRLADRRTQTMSAPVRVRVRGSAARGVRTRSRGLGRLDVMRSAHASWYGPGLYGNHLGCGGRLGTGTLGVAHKSLPCGTKVTFRHGGRSVRVAVIDRGPYVGGREYDLTAATARRLGFSGHGAILTTR